MSAKAIANLKLCHYDLVIINQFYMVKEIEVSIENDMKKEKRTKFRVIFETQWKKELIKRKRKYIIFCFLFFVLFLFILIKPPQVPTQIWQNALRDARGNHDFREATIRVSYIRSNSSTTNCCMFLLSEWIVNDHIYHSIEHQGHTNSGSWS